MLLRAPARSCRGCNLTAFSHCCWAAYTAADLYRSLRLSSLSNVTVSSIAIKTFPNRLHCRTLFSQTSHVRAQPATQAIPSSPTEVQNFRDEAPPRPRVLHPPSDEQQAAIDILLHSNDNLIVDACAGSGKTVSVSPFCCHSIELVRLSRIQTTILHLATAAPNTNFLVLVYNRRLMLETTERVKSLRLENITVLNYHTLGVRYYTAECATDQGLKRVVEDDMAVIDGMALPDFSVLVMDEQQDMTPILKRFVDKIIRDKGFVSKTRAQQQQQQQSDKPKRRAKKKTTGGTLRVVVLGDRRQEVYGFNNADSRFLTMAGRPEVFGYINEHAWASTPQTTSNRVTQQNVDFINPQMLKMPQGAEMRAARSRDTQGRPYPKPRYVVCDPRGEDLLEEIVRLLQMDGVSPTDIIVLAPSVRGSSPALYLANALALKGFPVFRSDSDVSDIPPEVADGKILICTYHQAKGIERKAAIVLGFDQTYHTLYDKVAAPPTASSNPQYVAATRALEHLVLVHDYKSAPLPFVNMDTLGESCDLVLVRDLEIEEPKARASIPTFAVTSLCRNLSETLITECLKRLNVDLLSDPAYGITPPPTLVADRFGLWEGVSNITGTAVPAIFQWRSKKALTLLTDLFKLLEPPKRKISAQKPIRQLPPEYFERLGDIRKAYEEEGIVSTEDILFVANMDMAEKHKDTTKLLAIPFWAYTWLSETHCMDIAYTLRNLPEPAKLTGRGIYFETTRHRKFLEITHGGGPTSAGSKGVILSGAMDMCRARSSTNTTTTATKNKKTVWEIKYTDSLHPEHLLQVALYMLLLGSDALGFLVSARTGQTVQVLPRTKDSLQEILQLLVASKSGGEQKPLLNTYSDEEFLAECRRDFGGLVDRCALPAGFSMRPVGSKYKRWKGAKKRGLEAVDHSDTQKVVA